MVQQVDRLQGVEVAAEPGVVDPVLPELFVVQHHADPAVLIELDCGHQVVLLQVGLAALHQHRAYRAEPQVLVPVLRLTVIEVVRLVLSYIVAEAQVDQSAREVRSCSGLERGVAELAGRGEGEVGLPEPDACAVMVMRLHLIVGEPQPQRV